MRADAHFAINEAQAVYEVFDGEVLAINLETGKYYSMLALSAQVWRWLIDGVPLGRIAAALEKICSADRPAVVAQLEAFLAKLAEEGLIVPGKAAPAEADPVLSQPMAAAPLTLAVEVYTEMQDLLLLDPIHDVEEEGWPLARATAGAPGAGAPES